MFRNNYDNDSVTLYVAQRFSYYVSYQDPSYKS